MRTFKLWLVTARPVNRLSRHQPRSASRHGQLHHAPGSSRFVDTFKRALSKSHKTNVDNIQEILRAYRATPNSRGPFGKSPAELLYGRPMRLPISNILPPPALPDSQRNTMMEQQFNRKHGAVPRSFAEEERVLIRLHKAAEWKEASIIEQMGNVMYNVLLQGRVLRLHANQIRRNPANSLPDDVLYDDPEPVSNNVQPAPPPPPPVAAPRRNWRAPTRTSPISLRPRK